MSTKNIDFNNIRPINGSLEKGFEEFICQLAKRETIPNVKEFKRNGTPDAGCECYWILNNGEEYAWQAKYFKTSLGPSQFKQIEESIEIALEKHPNIVKYFIAIPQNLPDVRIIGKLSAKDKLDRKLKEWHEKYLKTKFVLWQLSDLIERIQKSENVKLIKFWFDKEFLSEEWFKRQNENAIADLGVRYTPEINVELDISKVFDVVDKNDNFIKEYKVSLDSFVKEINRFINYIDGFLLASYTELKKYGEVIKESKTYLIEPFNRKKPNFDFNEIRKHLSIIRKNIIEISEFYFERITPEIQNLTKEKKDRYEHFKYLLQEIRASSYKFNSFVNKRSIDLYDNPFLVVYGNAGCGKSYLLADIVKKRRNDNKYSILLLGQKFRDGRNPRTQLLEQLGLKVECNFEDFLYALHCITQINESRVIIFIDAINESTPINFWKEELNSFIQDIKRYDGLSLVLSVRSTYLSLFEHNIENFVKIEHFGFDDKEGTVYNAIKTFFSYYKLPLPNIPLLLPEFANPLFLKLFCKGLRNKNIQSIDDEKIEPSYIFNLFINSINEKLCGQSVIVNIVKEFIDKMLSKEIENNFSSLTCIDCEEMFAEINRKYNIQNLHLNDLISEGLLIKDYSYAQKMEVVYIAYEKLKDYLIAERISKQNIKNLKKTINKHPYAYRGIIEALAIVFPKYNNIEIFDFFKLTNKKKQKYFKSFIDNAFLQSLPYRNNSNCDVTKLNKYINKNKLYATEDFLEILVACSTKINNPFYAEKTHKWLNKFSMADRDSFWIPFLNNCFQYNSSSVNRIIDWALLFEDKSNIDDTYIELTATMISWFLASSNRILRDKATKAVIFLLMDRPKIVVSLLRKFEKINDPYIYERLYAIAYGVATRIKDKNILKELSEYIYEMIFNKKDVYPNILLRDYARNIIEYSIHLGVKINIELNRICPPYKSKFPKIVKDSIIEKYNNKKAKELLGSKLVFLSMQVEHDRSGKGILYGDFGRYVFQSNVVNFLPTESQKNNFVMNMKNVAIKYIFDMGYDNKKHGTFDVNENEKHYDRHYTSTERIGKKYQWIAMYKLLAQLSDKYKIKDFWDKKEFVYEGPWNLSVRDFDPTNLGRQFKPSKTVQINYDNWDTENSKWLGTIKDLPKPINILNFDNHIWIPLNIFFNMDEPNEIGQESYSEGKKDFWYLINSYFVESKEFIKITKWLSSKNFHGRWLPEQHSLYQIFSREYISLPGFKQLEYLCNYEILKDKKETNQFEEKSKEKILQFKFLNEKTKKVEIKKIIIPRKKNIIEKEIGKVYFTELPNYSWEMKNENLDVYHVSSIKKPSETLFKYFNLEYKQYDNCLYLPSGELACFDYDGILYFRADLLNKFLSAKNFKMIWALLGEKRVIKKDYKQDWLEISSVYILRKNNKIEKKSTKIVPSKNYK